MTISQIFGFLLYSGTDKKSACGWEAFFVRMLRSDAGKGPRREALETIKEIFKIAGSSGKEKAEVENSLKIMAIHQPVLKTYLHAI